MQWFNRLGSAPSMEDFACGITDLLVEDLLESRRVSVTALEYPRFMSCNHSAARWSGVSILGEGTNQDPVEEDLESLVEGEKGLTT